MTNTTAQHLIGKAAVTSRLLGFDVGPQYRKDTATGGYKAVVGAVALEHQPYAGWAMKQITNEAGGIHYIGGESGLRASEMRAFLAGMIVAAERLAPVVDAYAKHVGLPTRPPADRDRTVFEAIQKATEELKGG